MTLRHLASSAVNPTSQASETHLKLALEVAQMGTWDWNLVTNEVIYSEQFAPIFGIAANPSPLTFEAFINSIHPEDRPKVQHAISKAFIRETDHSLEFRTIWPDGTVHWIDHKGQVYYNEAGKPIRMLGVVMDVTDRKQAQIALQASQQRFAGILEIASDAIISVDESQQITLFNQGAEKIFGYAAAEVLGHPLSLLLPQRFAATHEHHVKDFQQATHRSRQMSDRGVVFGRRKDGTEFPAEVSISKLEVAGEKIFTAILRDVTERQQAEATLQQRSQHLAAVIAALQNITINSTSLDDVMTAIVEHTQHLTHADGAAIEILEDHELVYRAASGIASQFIGLRLKVTHSLSGQCVQTGELLQSDDTETDPRVDRSLCQQVGIRAMLLVPLHYQGQRVGVLKTLSVTPAKFTALDTQTLQLMSGFLAASICLATESETKTALLTALQESENRYRSMVNVLAEGIILQQKNGQIIACNRSAEQILGLTNEQMIGRSSLDPQWRTIHEDGSAFSGETHPAIVTLRTGQPQSKVVMGVYRSDGILTWLSINSQPLFLPEGSHPYAVVTSFVDITPHKQAEIALRQQAERERMIYTITQHIRQSLDLHTTLNTTVSEVRRFLACDRVIIYRFNPDWSGVIVMESVAPGWRSILNQQITDTYFVDQQGQVYQDRAIRVTSNIYTVGLNQCHIDLLEELQVKAKLVAPIWLGEQLWGLLVAHQCSAPREWQDLESEILIQLAAQAAIAIQQSELHRQLQHLNADLERQVKARTAELQLAYDFEATLKRITDKVRDSLDEAQIMQTAVEELAQALGSQCCNATLHDPEGQKAVVRYEYQTSACSHCWCLIQIATRPEIYSQLVKGDTVHFCVTYSDQAQHRVGILVHPIFDDQEILGDLWLMASSYHCFHEQDIRLVQQVANQCAIALRQSRLYRAAQVQVQELERLNHLKDDFLSTISHELRTPMSSIKMALQMLDIHLHSAEIAERDSATISHYLQILHSESQRELNLINDLLDLTRINSDTEPLNLSPIYLQFWLPHVAEPFIERTRNQEQQLQVWVPEDLPPLTSDLSYLERVLTELLHNACKYTPAGETIAVSAQATATEIILEVSNSGVEIAPEERQRIFDKFYRIPKHDPWKYGGTGLGLALVQRFVSYLGGQITVTSAQQQTTFSVRLPQKTADGKPVS